MATSPIVVAMSEMLEKLKLAIQRRNEIQTQIAEYTNAIKALAQVCDEEDVRTAYLVALDELSGKPGFLDAIRTILRPHHQGLTPGVIRAGIQKSKIMDLSGYSNPLASIHTTLRRMVESEEIELFQNEQGEKLYRLKAKKPTLSERVRQMAPPPMPAWADTPPEDSFPEPTQPGRKFRKL